MTRQLLSNLSPFEGISLFIFAFVFMLSGATSAQYSVTSTSEQVIDFTGYDGTGFAITPAAGQLDADDWAITGSGEGDKDFGVENTTGDYARGTGTGGNVTSGGLYSFDVGSGDATFGFQPTGSDFTPIMITLKIQNNTGVTVTQLDLGYNINVFNDNARSNSLNFSHSPDNTTYTSEVTLDFQTTEIADETPAWSEDARSLNVTGLSIANGDFYYIRWTSDDITGSGSRDEIAIDDISITMSEGSSAIAPVNQATSLTLVSQDTRSLELTWVDGADGDKYLVEVVETGTSFASLTDGVEVPDDFDFSDGSGSINLDQGTEAFTFTDLKPGQGYDIRIVAWGSGIGQPAFNQTAIPSLTNEVTDASVTSFTIDFEGSSITDDGVYRYDALGAQEWTLVSGTGADDTGGFARMSGFDGATVPNVDWLIMPPVDFDVASNAVLDFYISQEFGTYSAVDTLELYLISGYDGISDPESATLEPLVFDLSTAVDTFGISTSVDLMGQSGVKYIAFKYISEVDSWRTHIDEIVLSSTSLNPSVAIAFTEEVTEGNLNDAVINITLTDETFTSASGDLGIGNITLLDAPTGASVESFTANTSSTAIVNLAFDNTDFDSDVTTFDIEIASSILTNTSTGSLSSENNLTITAVIEDDIAPEFIENFPDASEVLSTSFKLNIQLDEAGSVDYVILADGEAAPSVVEVQAGTGSGGASSIANGSVEIPTPLSTEVITISELTENTGYDVYLVAEDNATPSNVQAEVTKLDVSTLSASAPVATLAANSPTALQEDNLDGATVDISLANDTFADQTFEASNFTTSITGLTVSAASGTTSDITLTLAFDGTDFDEEETLTITIAAVELTSSANLTTNNSLAVEAVIEFAFEDLIDADAPVFEDNLSVEISGTYQVPGEVFGLGSAEIVAYDAPRFQAFFTDANSDVVRILDVSDPNNPSLINTIELSGSPNSVAVYKELVAVAVEADIKTNPGKVEFFSAVSFSKLGEVTVGALPDMVVFNEDGTKVLTANEGEPSDDYSVDPEGSVSVISINEDDISASVVSTADFNSVSIPEDVRIFGKSAKGTGDAATGSIATPGQDMEPEYIAISGETAYVTCQENNALAIVDIATATVTSVLALGTQDHSQVGNGIDASDKDDVIRIAQWPIKGFYMPDAIASFESDGKAYLVTANEGDARSYEYDSNGENVLAFGEETRVKDLLLDATAFPDGAAMQADDALGRYTVTTVEGDTDDDGEFEELYGFGTRSFTIWDAADGSVVWDSKNDLEQLIKQRHPDHFNATDDENNFDNRSDNKGPEPEGVVVGKVNGKMHAFIGLERIGGVVAYDISTPTDPVFAFYVNNRNFEATTIDLELGFGGDLSPEGLAFVPAFQSPTKTALLIVTNEVSGTVTTYQVGEVEDGLDENTDPEPPLFTNTLDMTLKGSFKVPGEVFDVGAAEIPAFDVAGKQIFFTDGNSEVVHVLDAVDISNLTLKTSLSLSGSPTSVAVYDTLVAVAVEAETKQDNGKVEFWGTESLTKLGEVTVGALPDMVVFNEDGTVVLTANEGEPSDDYLTDPEGSVSVITLNGSDLSSSTVQTADFKTVTIPEGVRLFGRSANGAGDAADGTSTTAAEDMEPEYISVVGSKAYVTCQENNALAIVDIPSATVESVIALGTQDHSEIGNGIDASDKDGKINIAQWPVKGFYMPDAIASFTVADKNYLITANEGDAREYEYEFNGADVLAFSEEARVRDLSLDATAFPNADELQADEALGRLTVTTIDGDTDGDDDIDELYSFGTRSFTIWDAADGSVVWDSKNELEQITAQRNPIYFNSSNDKNEFDSRSNNKGPEPEGVVVGSVGNHTYAFVGLERVGGIVAYEISDPTAPTFAGYINNRNFNVDESGIETELAGDLAPEGLVFVAADNSPSNTALLIVTNEVSGTVSLFELGEAIPADFTLTILHNNDAQSQLLPDEDIGGVARFSGLVKKFKQQATNAGQEVVLLSAGNSFLAGPELDASLALSQDKKYYDAIAIEKMGYDAHAIGRHEFDFGPDVLSKFVADTDAGLLDPTTFITANLDFALEDTLSQWVNESRISKSIMLDKGGEKIGIIGLTTPDLPLLSVVGDVTVSAALATVVQSEIDALETNGVNKIILISDLGGLDEEIGLVKLLNGVDVVIAGGKDQLLSNNSSALLPGDQSEGVYPTIGTDLNGDNVYFVTTTGKYQYLGRLVVNFDANGDVISIGDNSGVFAVMTQLSDIDPIIKAAVENPVAAHIEALSQTTVATSDVALDGLVTSNHGVETNLGNLITDAYVWQAGELAEEYALANQPRVALSTAAILGIDEIIEPGTITALNIFEILPSDNKLTAIENVSPSQLKNILENAVSRIELVDPGADGGPTMYAGEGTQRFAQMGGFSIVFDPAAEPIEIQEDELGNVTSISGGERIVSVRLDNGTSIISNGMPSSGAPDVTVITVDNTARGAYQYPFVDESLEPLSFKILGGVQSQQAFRNYLEAAGGRNGSILSADYDEEGEGRISPLLDLNHAKDLAQGRGVAVRGVITTNDYGFGNGQFYIQDGIGSGINVFYDDVGGGDADPLLFEAADSVLIVGTLGSFSDQLQLSADTVEVLAEAATIPAAVEISGADLSLESALQGSRVRLSGVSLDQGAEWPTEPISSSSGLNLTAVTSSESRFTLRIDRGESFYDGSEAPNGFFILEGTLGRNNDDVQILPFFQGDVNTAPIVVTEIEDITRDEGFSTIEKNLVEVFADQYGDLLTYESESSTTGVASVDITNTTLNVSEEGIGTVTITVTATDSKGQSVSDSFTVTINQVLGLGNEIEGLAVYPIPAGNEINVTHESVNIRHAIIYELDGKMVLTKGIQNGKVDVSQLRTGIYMLSLLDEGKNEIARIRILKR